MAPLPGCQHGSRLKVFSGTSLAVTKTEALRTGEAPIFESLEITKKTVLRASRTVRFLVA